MAPERDAGGPVAGSSDLPPGLEPIADELYAGSPDDFVRVRGERAKQARAGGDRALATAVGALRRPTRSAWTVNLLAREAADELGALLDLGEALRAAQESLSGPDLRRLSAQRHQAVEALVRRASELALSHGTAATEAVRREVGQALQAALADPATGAQVRAGRLDRVPEYGGFGVFVAAGVPDAPAPPPDPDRAGSEGPDRGQGGDEDEAVEQRRLAAEQAERARLAEALEQAVAGREQAEDGLSDAQTEAQTAEDDLAGLRDRLAAAERQAAASAAAVAAAREQLEECRADEQRARAELDAVAS